MTALVPQQLAVPYAADLAAHLDEQLASARRLLDHVLEQGRAIRERDVEEVLVLVATIQAEMERRGGLERDRTTLLLRAAASVGVPAHALDLEALLAPLGAHEAARLRATSAELRGLLDEVRDEHRANRALMRQELAFVDHLLRTLTGADDPGYGPAGRTGTARVAHRPAVRPARSMGGLDLRA